MNKGFEILTKSRKNQLLKIVYRAGYERYILDGTLYLPNGEKISCWTLENYNESLRTYEKDEQLEIMKIMDCTGKVLWERPREIPKLTPAERTILENIPMEWKYIARDENGDLWLYKVKPYKDESGFWTNGNFDNAIRFKLFNQIFEFIEWEDEKPYCIKELLAND